MNGITDAMVADAPEIEEAIGDFMDFIGDNILWGIIFIRLIRILLTMPRGWRWAEK